MKRIAILLASLMAVLTFMGGCQTAQPDVILSPAQTIDIPEQTGEQGPLPTEPAAQSTGFAAYELRQETVYYPEGSAPESAEYMLNATLPFFTAKDEAAANMNAAVELYRAELIERVVNERLPLADRAEGEELPSTVVSLEMEFAGAYLNVCLYEDASYGDNAEHAIHTLVFSKDGQECSLAAVAGVFDPSDLAAQQVLNQIAKDESVYYGDVTAETAKLALDLYNAFAVTESGYILYAAEGTLAKPELAILSFFVDKAAFYPDFVGDAIPAEHYEALENAVNLLARACAVDYTSFSSGSPNALCASGFFSGLLSGRGVTSLSKQEYETLFSAYFTGVFPADLSAAGDGTVLSGDVYTIAAVPMATYSVELSDARLENGTITLSGSLLYGVPGEADAAIVAPVEIVLQQDDVAEIGYRFEAFSIY